MIVPDDVEASHASVDIKARNAQGMIMIPDGTAGWLLS